MLSDLHPHLRHDHTLTSASALFSAFRRAISCSAFACFCSNEVDACSARVWKRMCASTCEDNRCTFSDRVMFWVNNVRLRCTRDSALDHILGQSVVPSPASRATLGRCRQVLSAVKHQAQCQAPQWRSINLSAATQLTQRAEAARMWTGRHAAAGRSARGR